MTRVEETSYVSVARVSMQTQFSRFLFKTEKHNRPKSATIDILADDDVTTDVTTDDTIDVNVDAVHVYAH